ncbi:DUF803-domain-containing protein [Artomyces pyxidatus]|uniref:DUF803-domain-containing protein n=1 Tax=Artomyces pyxidatus TaxID=48021 RepID=A0ACB8TKK2_9AGAM|nr:DUF803-domain-containing protein [Artomyces pyxidatus]
MPVWPSLPNAHGIDGIELPHVSRGTVVGITVAIAGNVLISLALNLQKMAHARLDAERRAWGGAGAGRERSGGGAGAEDRHEMADGAQDDEVQEELAREARAGDGHPPEGSDASETEPLISIHEGELSETVPLTHTYGAVAPVGVSSHDARGQRPGKARRTWGLLLRFQHRGVRDARTQAPEDGPKQKPPTNGSAQNDAGEGQETDYLRSKLWWFGFILMNVGEIGNFISYAFAPASTVAPLGTFALIANCFFAPVLLGERFRKRDLLGIAIAIIGAVTVVLSSNTSDKRLSPDEIKAAVSQRVFVVYSIVYASGVVILAGLSEGPVGRMFVLVDLGLCSLFGGFTVLATKGVSTLLTTRGFEMFKEWITYPIIAVLIGTGVGQIKYLNRALMRFDSKVVIPTQFVLFNLSAILGSAILYGDFRRAKFHEFVTFLYGCATTFAGVWIIAYTPTPSVDADGGNDESGSIEVLVSGPPREGPRRRSVATALPFVRRRQSTLSLVGLSPAQVRTSFLVHASFH